VHTPNQTGRWLHPRMDEVVRRRNATNFDRSNMKAVAISAGVLIFSLFVMPGLNWAYAALQTETRFREYADLAYSIPQQWLRAIHPYPLYILWAIRSVFLFNASLASLPLLRTPDACEDVPLTPQQRQLLGLPPMSRPATPQEKVQYVTPPRFSRSNTPRSAGNTGMLKEGSDSPLSGRGTPNDSGNGTPLRAPNSGSPYNSPAPYRSFSGSGGPGGSGSGAESTRRRLSYTNTRSSPLTVSEFESMGQGTPSKRASVGLNNKWLYEKGRAGPKASPGGGRMGSLFI
jgi:nucleoporin POM34